VNSLIMYFVPLVIARWQQQREGLQHVRSVGVACATSTPADKAYIHGKQHSAENANGIAPSGSCSEEGTSRVDTSAGNGSQCKRASEGGRLSREAESSHEQEGSAGQQGQGEPALQANQQHHQQRVEDQIPPLHLSVADIARMALSRRTALYTSPLQHSTVSLKVGDTSTAYAQLQLVGVSMVRNAWKGAVGLIESSLSTAEPNSDN
jgi:hypothetical protein